MNNTEFRWERFIRRQWRTIVQMWFAINILMILGVGILWYLSNLIINNNFNPICWGKIFFLLSAISILISVLLGIIITLNRLEDFRKTTKIANPKINEEEKKYLRIKTKLLWWRTRKIFKRQMRTLFLGIVAIIVSLIITYHQKLF